MSDKQSIEEQSIDDLLTAFYPDESAEPLKAPTAETSTDDNPSEAENNELVKTADELESEKLEESEGEESGEGEDVLTVEIDGNEHNLTDITDWKQTHDNIKSMQADCTKKWTEAADLRKEAESQMSKASDLTLELEALVAEDEEVDLEDLKDIDPDEYIKVSERLAKRKAKVEELKANQPQAKQVLSKEELLSESNDFYTHDPLWVGEDKKLTNKFRSDMKQAQKYLQDKGYSQDEVNNITLSHHWKTIVDASKFNALKRQENSIKKKLLKTPKATKPKATTANLSAEEVFYGKK